MSLLYLFKCIIGSHTDQNALQYNTQHSSTIAVAVDSITVTNAIASPTTIPIAIAIPIAIPTIAILATTITPGATTVARAGRLITRAARRTP